MAQPFDASGTLSPNSGAESGEFSSETTATIVDLFEEQVLKSASLVALKRDSWSISYAEFNAEANALGSVLRGRGIGGGHRVGICLPRGPEFAVAVLAVLKTGAAYVPLDVDYPPERLDFLVADSAPAAIVGGEIAADICARTGLAHVGFDSAREHARSSPNLDVPIAADDPAYVIYTSGTTGKPKGVVVRHGSVAVLIGRAAAEFGFGPGDTVLQAHSFSFDFSVWEMWTALAYGGTLTIASHEETADPRRIASLMARESVTVLNQTPSSLYRLWREVVRNQAAQNLRLVVFGGERLDPAKLNKALEHGGHTGVEFVNMYGITEATVHVTKTTVEISRLAREQRSMIGTPIAGATVSVRDQAGNACPEGVTGELWVGGAGVALGYLNLPELTARKFVTVLHRDGTSERYYRSGDLGREHPGGQLEFVGRADRQASVRGYRVEPAEVERALLDRCAVRQAVVLADDESLSAFVVTGDGAPAVQEMRRRIGELLPSHLVPSEIVVVDEIPLDPHGKLDADRLRRHARASTAARSGPPSLTPTQRAVLAVWQEVLDRPIGDIDTNFFDAGGHSLALVDVVDKLTESGYAVGVTDLFGAPTIRACAAHLDRSASRENGTSFADRRRKFAEVAQTFEGHRRGESGQSAW